MSLSGTIKLFVNQLVGLTPHFIRYTFVKVRMDRQYDRKFSTSLPLSPGTLREVTPLPNGARLEYSQAELEIIFLAPDLARLSWEPGIPPVAYAIARSEWPVVDTHIRPSEDGYILSTASLQISARKDGSLAFTDGNSQWLREELPPEFRDVIQKGHPPTSSTPIDVRWTHRARMAEEECIYGLGERAAPHNRRGGIYRMWNVDPRGSYGPGTDPLYICIPVYLSIHPAGSYLIFYENYHPSTFDFTAEISQASFMGGMLRYYFIPGPPWKALERYTELTGRSPLPPRWALGFHQCRWGYRQESDVRSVAAGFKEHNLPLSTIHLDADYMDGYRVFTIDKTRFPDMPALTKDLHQQGIRLVTILDPGVKCDEQYFLYKQGLQGRRFCTLPDGKPLTGLVWPGWTHFPDFTDAEARRWWGEQYHILLEAGISGFWHDMNEPSSFTIVGNMTLPKLTQHHMEGMGGDHLAGHNLYGLLMDRAGYEALRTLQPDRRPWLLTRSGWAGVQRYAWNWTGDTDSSWEVLRQTVSTLLGLGLSGLPFNGSDIGGFNGNPSAELFLRWFQVSAFFPFFRTHSVIFTPPREPWRFGEPYLSILREYLRLRYRLMPYLYTLAWHTSLTGHPVIRPLFWPDAGDPALWAIEDAFFLGDALLVAPILEPGATSRELTIPAGKWFSFWDDTLISGPGTVRLSASLEHIPILVRAGSALPLEDGEALTIHLYAPDKTALPGVQQLYSDAGDGYGDWRLDRFRLSLTGEAFEIKMEQEGKFPFPYIKVIFHIHGIRSHKAWIDGQEISVVANRIESDHLPENVIFQAQE